jgi:hypothetical protein
MQKIMKPLDPDEFRYEYETGRELIQSTNSNDIDIGIQHLQKAIALLNLKVPVDNRLIEKIQSLIAGAKAKP